MRRFFNKKLGFTVLIVLIIIFIVSFSGYSVHKADLDDGNLKTPLNELSERFLEHLKKSEDTKTIEDQLAKLSLDSLETTLSSDAQRYAFWINIYNAYILVILKEHPEYYNDKGDFFSKEQITIAGETISFAKIEHGIIRKSQWQLGLGYFRTWFPDEFEKKLQVDNRDYRVHFALNCGAKDCPPVAIYTPKRIKEQLEKGTKTYLKKTSDYEASKNEVNVTPLFSWFRGDFGGTAGVKKILENYGITPNSKDVNLEFKDYDWTLDLDNFIDL